MYGIILKNPKKTFKNERKTERRLLSAKFQKIERERRQFFSAH